MTDTYEEMIKPGAGVPVERLPLTPIKAALIEGDYVINPRLEAEIDYALANIDQISPREAQLMLQQTDNKGFRNAYTSVMMEHVWTPYSARVSGENMQIYTGSFDSVGHSQLEGLQPEALEHMTAAEIANTIAASNQAVLSHYVCEEFADGRVPNVTATGNIDKDRAYLAHFQKQTDLVMRAGNFFPAVPKEAGSPSVFITSGVVVVRTHIMGMPNVISAVAARDSIDLTPDQHRESLKETLRGSIMHYYLPSGPLTISINTRLVDPATLALRPETFTHNGDADKLLVFPRPDIVQGVNEAFQNGSLPAQTNCPAFHSKVQTTEEPTVTVPLPRSLPDIALQQFDAWYYPRFAQEYHAAHGA